MVKGVGLGWPRGWIMQIFVGYGRNFGFHFEWDGEPLKNPEQNSDRS